MARGRKVTVGVTLTNYNSKIEPQTKKLLEAIATTQKLDGQRDLLNRMLETYEAAYPEDVKRAKEFINFRDEGSNLGPTPAVQDDPTLVDFIQSMTPGNKQA